MTDAKKLETHQRVNWLRLTRTPNIGPVTFAQLLARFGTAGAALEALPDLARRTGRKRPLKAPSIAQVEDEIAATQHHGAQLIAACEPDYPPLLRAVDPPPPMITVLGRTDLFTPKAIAMVGARNASAAGRKIARDMAETLGAAGYTIVSGMALGIDGEAHAASLDTGTIAVLGGGVDHIYPGQHDRLYAALADQGTILSESPFGHRATAKDFPRRNRIVTGLAVGTVVIEAAERSGSLISARTANEQGREVMAVPGSPLEPRSKGTNRLIREGATMVTSADEVLEAVSMLGQLTLRMPPPATFETEQGEDTPPPDQIAAVLEALTFTPLPMDEIARAANIAPARCAAILMELEIGEQATTLPGGLAMRTA